MFLERSDERRAQSSEAHNRRAERQTLRQSQAIPQPRVGFIARFEAKRRRYGISVAELSRRVDVSPKRLWYILNGQREMRVNEFLKLCVALKLDPRSFVAREMVEEVVEATRRSIERCDDIGI